MSEREAKKANPFDRPEGDALKDAGMEVAAENRAAWLAAAREVAIEIAVRGNGTCTADQVGAELYRRGLPHNGGKAAGSIFKGGDWEFTGARVISARITNHGRELKVWRLV